MLQYLLVDFIVVYVQWQLFLSKHLALIDHQHQLFVFV